MRTLQLVGSPPARSDLIERAAELHALQTAVHDGGVVVVEAAAGLGKTALLDRAASLAVDAGYLVRRAAPAPLECHFSSGVLRALLEAPLGARLDDAGADSTQFAHEVLWLCSELAAKQPLALIVDDAQWADQLSLEVLAYLARRVEDVPLLIVLATREADPQLSLLGNVTVLHPAPLTLRGTAQLIGRADIASECHRATGGNPWLLAELGADAIAADVAVSPSARAVVRRRLAELSPRDRGVAEALAVIGDAAPHVAAAVAGVPVGELGPARDSAAGRGPARSGREAVRARADRGRDHRRADADRARALAPRGGACADGGGRGRAAGRLAPARVQPAQRSRGQRVPALRRGGRHRGRVAAGRRHATSSGRSRSVRRATIAGRCAPSSGPSRSTPVCRTRGGSCTTRCPRSVTATTASTCSRGSPR